MNNLQKKSSYLFQIFSFLFLIACFFYTVNYVRFHNVFTLDADESSELLLGNVLASENKLISDNWYYSTELEVLNTNLFFSFFFHLTDNWHQVRTLATISMYLMLLAAYYFMSRIFHFSRFFALSAAVLFVPFSESFYQIMLRGAYYYPFVTVSLFTLILAELFLKISGKKSAALLIFSFVLSVVIGLGGLRQLFFTYVPLLAASGVFLLGKEKKQKDKQWFLFSVVTFLGSLVGYVINLTVLSKFFYYETWGDVDFTLITFTHIGEILNDIFLEFGYSTGNIFSSALIKNAACAGWIFFTILAIWYAIKKRAYVSGAYLRLAVFVGCSYLIYIVFYSATNMSHSPHYINSITCASFALIALFFEEVEWKKKVSVVIFTLLVLLTAVSGFIFYYQNRDNDKNKEIRQISNFLVSEGYLNGYSTFWYGNTLTEFSNGVIDVWVIIDENKNIPGKSLTDVSDIDETYHWLQKVSHSTTHPAGKTFILFTRYGFKANNWVDNLKEEKIIYESPDFVIMGYESYEDLIDNLYPGYDVKFGEDLAMENGKDIDGHRELYYAGVSHGPYKTLWSGKYEIVINGKNLSEAELFCISQYGAIGYEPILVMRDDHTMHYVLEIPIKVYNFETLIRNMSDEQNSVVSLDSIRIRRITESE